MLSLLKKSQNSITDFAENCIVEGKTSHHFLAARIYHEAFSVEAKERHRKGPGLLLYCHFERLHNSMLSSNIEHTPAPQLV